jgi:hypothetical protein
MCGDNFPLCGTPKTPSFRITCVRVYTPKLINFWCAVYTNKIIKISNFYFHLNISNFRDDSSEEKYTSDVSLFTSVTVADECRRPRLSYRVLRASDRSIEYQ